MAKLNKYANIYDKEGNLVRKVGDKGVLEDYTIEEMEELAKKLREDVDENGYPKDQVALRNVSNMIVAYYQNPKHMKEFMDKYIKIAKKDEENTAEAVEDVREQLEQPTPNLEPEYVEFEPIEEPAA